MFTDRASGNKIYYIDPFHFPKDKDLKDADIIFVTHAHPDHLSPEDIGLVLKESTVLVATDDSLITLNLPNEKVAVTPNMEYEVKGFKFQTVPAYNTNTQRPHKKEYGWVGYIFMINGLKVYHAGDTDLIPEMKAFDKLSLDIAFLPIGGTYTMDVDEAIEAANIIKAKKTAPIHYRRLLGDNYREAEERFKKGVTGSEVVILEQFK